MKKTTVANEAYYTCEVYREETSGDFLIENQQVRITLSPADAQRSCCTILKHLAETPDLVDRGTIEAADAFLEALAADDLLNT